MRAVPPVAADGAAGDEFGVFIFDALVDVEMPLEDGDEIMAFERFQNLLGICDGERAVFGRGPSRIGAVGGERRDERDVNDAKNGRAGRRRLEIGGKPGHLFVVDARFPQPILGWLDRIEHDEVVALVIEGVVRFSDAVFVHLLAVGRIAGGDTAFFDDAKWIVISNGMVHGHLQGLFGLFVKIKHSVGSLGPDGRCVVNVIAAHDGEIGFECRDFLEAHVAAVWCLELRFDVCVGKENKVEATWSLRVRG